MALPRFLGSHPRLAVLAGVALAALAFLVVPFSYDRVVGQEVTLTLVGDNLTPETVRGIARELGGSFEHATVNVASRIGEQGPRFILVAQVPGEESASAGAVSEAFAHTLREKGYEVEATVAPVKEKTSGSLYAMAFDNTIRVSVDGKSADELETEIATRLAEAGVPNAQVSVTREGADCMKIEVKAESEGEEGATGNPPQLVLTSDGQDLGGACNEAARCEIRAMKKMDEAGEHLVLEVSHSGQTCTATVDDPGSLSDADLAAAIQQQLAAAGLGDLSVSVLDGRVEVLCVGTDALAPQSGDSPVQQEGSEKATWGGLKKKYN